ncbi:hypothetical protein IAT38_002088 [Cryptococcus sp. DSM 104549]
MSHSYLSVAPGLTYNYSLYAVPAGWLIGMVPLWWAVAVSKKHSRKGYSNANPGESWKTLKEAALPPKIYGRVTRAVAANNNTHINFPLFVACLGVANAAHVSANVLHACTTTWLLARVAYNFAYILIEDDKKSAIRSLLYFTGVLSCLTLAINAAQKYSSVPW